VYAVSTFLFLGTFS